MMMFCDIQNIFQVYCHALRFPEVHLKKILSVTKHGFCLRNSNNSLELYKALRIISLNMKVRFGRTSSLSDLLKTSDCRSFIVLETFITYQTYRHTLDTALNNSSPKKLINLISQFYLIRVL